MAYSYMTAVSDGTLKSMPITFNYMKEDDLVVHQNVTRLTRGIDYTINNNIITFAKAIPALDRVAVDRMSQRDSLRVNFVEGATFSRENMDDVLTQMLYLTQEAMEGSVDRISPTGVLDLAGNRIINLGDPIDLQDAVPLHLVVDAEKSIYASEAKCKQYRDEALGYKNEAFTYADRAYASELNAKKSEDNAKASEINAANSASSILGAVDQSAESAAAAKVSETNAKASENKTEAMVDRVEDALVAVEEYDDRLIAVENKKFTASDVGALRAIPLDLGFCPDGYSVSMRLFTITSEGSHIAVSIAAQGDHGWTSRGWYDITASTRRGNIEVSAYTPSLGSRPLSLYYKKVTDTLFEVWGSFATYNRPTNLVIHAESGATVTADQKGYGRLWDGYTSIPISVLYSTTNKPSAKDIGALATSDIVGSVSGGSLFESGSDEFGGYILFPDGTKICYMSVTYIHDTSDNGMTVTYPNGGFNIGQPIVTVTPAFIASGDVAGSFVAEASSVWLKSVKIKLLVHTPTAVKYPVGEVSVHIIAIGRVSSAATLEEPVFEQMDYTQQEIFDTTHERIATLEAQVAALLAAQKNMLPYDPEI